MKNLVKEFKAFIAQGSFIELALAVIIGGAFAPVIKAFVDNVFLALVAAIFGKPNFDQVGAFTLNGAQVLPGTVLTALFTFLAVMAASFAMMKAYNKFRKPTAAAEEAADPSVELLAEIRDLLAAKN